MPKDLRTYLDELLEKRPKDVVVVDREVDPRYEASAIVEKFERENKFPLVFFKNIKGSKFPLVINLGATYERLALALGSPSVPQMVKDLATREHNPAAMICKERGTGAVNVGIYRHQKQGKRQLGLMINPANHANYVRAEYEDHNEPMEVALAIGHHPALNLAAVTKQAGVGAEMELAGAFLGEPLEVVKAETVSLMVPARCEIVIEGVVPPK